MTPDPTGIVGFLTARIAEDEAVAQAARPSEHLRTRDNGSLAVVEDDGYSTCSITSGRVLREVAAKRLQMEGHTPQSIGREPWVEYDCDYCSGDTQLGVRWPCAEVRILASVYAVHPDYREEWRP